MRAAVCNTAARAPAASYVSAAHMAPATVIGCTTAREWQLSARQHHLRPVIPIAQHTKAVPCHERLHVVLAREHAFEAVVCHKYHHPVVGAEHICSRVRRRWRQQAVGVFGSSTREVRWCALVCLLTRGLNLVAIG